MDMKRYAQMQNIYEHPDFKEIIALGDRMINQWERGNTVGETEFETIRLSMEREYKIKGLTEFFHTLYQLIYDSDAKETLEGQTSRLTE